ncbi:MAG TPA: shikimate kinase [Pyrinomonadaceae bacterium]|jgi:shikimate kinase|nr:shikimate kinase [Pyrinomonadaceae bacterium]
MNKQLIAITGFMAAGKTTVGRALAKRLGCKFVDLDELIVARKKRSISQLIRADGEDRFRQLETETLAEVLAASGDVVMALGGGTWAREENRRLLNEQKARVVWLDAPFELCWQRIPIGDNGRPLAPSREVAANLYVARQPVYELAELRLAVAEGLSPEECASAITALL